MPHCPYFSELQGTLQNQPRLGEQVRLVGELLLAPVHHRVVELIQCRLWIEVSIWLTPPSMVRKMQDFALGVKMRLPGRQGIQLARLRAQIAIQQIRAARARPRRSGWHTETCSVILVEFMITPGM